MKKRKLKPWVIKTLQIVGAIIIIYLCIKWLEADYNKAMDYCTSQGNSYEYCKREINRYES